MSSELVSKLTKVIGEKLLSFWIYIIEYIYEVAGELRTFYLMAYKL